MVPGEVKISSKRYPEEFKIEAVRQIVDRGYSVAEVADRLGVTTHSLLRLEEEVWA
jgi:transposase